jgi:CubicO group peptidase (beta-lactamase class C family)
MNRAKIRTVLLFVIFSAVLLTVYFAAVGPLEIRFADADASSGSISSTEESLHGQVIKELQSNIPQWLKESDVPGAAVAVVDDRRILWKEVFGHTDRSKKKLVTAKTLFSIQSMSKSFTALGILMAVQDGLLDLDALITEYLPDFTVHSRYEDHPEKKMTLRHLLAHRAGFTHEAPLGSNFDSRPHTFAEHVLSISDTWLRYPVGYRYSYSNLGIDLAGYILERKSGIPFERYIREKVLIPLGMDDSTLDMDAIRTAPDRAAGHTSSRLTVPGGIPVEIPMIPAGGVYANIVDMAQYLMFHINRGRLKNNQVLKKELLEEMHTVAFPEKHQRFGYGLCLRLNGVSTTSYLSHGGGGYGFLTYMTMFPELKLGVVALTNSEVSAVSGDRIQSTINLIVEKRLGPTRPRPEKPTVDTRSPLAPEDERAKKLMGTYGNNVAIGYKDDVLGMTIGKEFYPLTFYREQGEIVGVFGLYSELRVKAPLLGQPGTLVHLNRLTGTCSYYDFQKPDSSIDKAGPDKPEWKALLGTFRTLKWGRAFDSLVNIRIVDGYLTLNGIRCREHLPGLFFTFDGEALDFRRTSPTFRNIMLIRAK